jgi:hypothetical protein
VRRKNRTQNKKNQKDGLYFFFARVLGGEKPTSSSPHPIRRPSLNSGGKITARHILLRGGEIVPVSEATVDDSTVRRNPPCFKSVVYKSKLQVSHYSMMSNALRVPKHDGAVGPFQPPTAIPSSTFPYQPRSSKAREFREFLVHSGVAEALVAVIVDLASDRSKSDGLGYLQEVFGRHTDPLWTEIATTKASIESLKARNMELESRLPGLENQVTRLRRETTVIVFWRLLGSEDPSTCTQAEFILKGDYS